MEDFNEKLSKLVTVLILILLGLAVISYGTVLYYIWM